MRTLPAASTAGRGRWGRHLRRVGEWRSRGSSSPGSGLGWFRLFRFLRCVGGLRCRARRLKLRDYWIGIDRRGGGGREIAGTMDYLHRDGNRLELVERIGDRKTGVGSGHGDGAWCLATRPEGCAGFGSLRHRLELNLHGGRGRLVRGEEQPARLAPDTAITKTRRMNDPPPQLRLSATIPGSTIRVSAQPCNRTVPHR